MRTIIMITGFATAAVSSVAGAAETTAFTYDARGRLKQVAKTGSINNGVNTAYQFDRAHNRTRKTITGAP